MIPTHKDLIIKGWKNQELFGPKNMKFGSISYFPKYNAYPERAYITACISNITRSTEVPLKNPVFNYIDYIPEWEQLMDKLLQTIFK